MTDESVQDTNRPLVVSLPEDRIHVGIGTSTYSLVINGSDTEEKFSCVDMFVPPGSGPVPHSHACEETFYVLEGEVFVFFRDQQGKDERKLATTGSAVNIPSWAPHVFHNLSKAPARLLCVVSPAGLERQFLEIGPRVPTRTSPPPLPTEEQLAELKKNLPAIVEKYHGRLLPPDTFDHLMTPEELQFLKDAEAS